jgi:ATP-dependent Clp protease ATP-binding subunit ClpA
MGARPMARLIQEKVKKPLAELILFGELSEKGGTVRIDLKDEDIILSVVHDEVVEFES